MTKKDKALFVAFVVIPPLAAEWWGFHKNALDELYLIFLLPLVIAGSGFSIWLAYYESKGN